MPISGTGIGGVAGRMSNSPASQTKGKKLASPVGAAEPTSSSLELVVNIFEGRKFPKLPAKHRVRVQAVVSDKVQETSPSAWRPGGYNISQPQWEIDEGGCLVWGLSNAELASLKACRAP